MTYRYLPLGALCAAFLSFSGRKRGIITDMSEQDTRLKKITQYELGRAPGYGGQPRYYRRGVGGIGDG